MKQRGGSDGIEHDGSRWMKTDLSIQMDGLATGSEHVFILAASNLPWDLDVALLRQLEKRMYIPLPTKAAHKSMLQMYFSQQRCQLDFSFDFVRLASETEGFSGSDIKLLCKDAAMRALRRIIVQLDNLSSVNEACSSVLLEKRCFQLVQKQIITNSDVQASFLSSKPSIDRHFSEIYTEWTRNFVSSDFLLSLPPENVYLVHREKV